MTISTAKKCYQFSSVRFEFDNLRLVWDQGTVIGLSRQEALILNVLCHNGGEVISYLTLSKSLLNGNHSACHSHAIPVSSLIAQLNTKLYQGSENELLISHVRDFGYRIQPPIDATTSCEKPEPAATKPHRTNITRQHSCDIIPSRFNVTQRRALLAVTCSFLLLIL
uniref:winged helix-turn-helix domain-containing protein n=1 Tax=Thaumasiovibrio occultus TaxID=1891184 RepID=UPI000B35CB28|nr:winged helix-turn-helix domain-containing protein [Thaumasiovibrio occultus]